jgi:predicted metal-dependent peptidase
MLGWSVMATTSSKPHTALFEKIRIHFLFNHPFLSVLALSIATRYTTNAKSAFQTDGFSLSIDEEKLTTYSEEEIIYLYAHTLLHIVLKHPVRRKAREELVWNQSCDVVINLILSEFDHVGVMPSDEVFDADMSGLSVEEVYEILYKEQEKKPNQEEGEKEQSKVYDETKHDLENPVQMLQSAQEQEKLDNIIIQALSIAQQATKAYDSLRVEIDTLLKPNIDLHDVLKEFLITALFEKTLTYNRPNRKYLHQGVYLPSAQKSKEQLELMIAIDSSGSVSLEEYKTFLGIVKEVCESFYEYSVTLLPFDLHVKEELIVSFDSFNPINSENLFIPKSDGGTNFNAVLDFIDTHYAIRSEHLLMVLSDGEFDIGRSLVCETLFVLSQKKNCARFERYGRVIQFNL